MSNGDDDDIIIGKNQLRTTPPAPPYTVGDAKGWKTLLGEAKDLLAEVRDGLPAGTLKDKVIAARAKCDTSREGVSGMIDWAIDEYHT